MAVMNECSGLCDISQDSLRIFYFLENHCKQSLAKDKKQIQFLIPSLSHPAPSPARRPRPTFFKKNASMCWYRSASLSAVMFSGWFYLCVNLHAEQGGET